MLYDLVIVIPFFVLWSRTDVSRLPLNLAIVVYLAALIGPILTEKTEISFLGILPILLLGGFVFHIRAYLYRT